LFIVIYFCCLALASLRWRLNIPSRQEITNLCSGSALWALPVFLVAEMDCKWPIAIAGLMIT
jgi:hypothetical protein